jgi:hypothetical protein
MANETGKKAREKQVFARFADSAGLAVVEGTFKQPDPPAPDIVVRIASLGHSSGASGLRAAPTPPGVPVMITLPGSRVIVTLIIAIRSGTPT